ncbi:Uncharacterised protein [Budvicia aquatica]|uniref:Uncharacterized protein n=1 Tax=Budvicia aquatica TaxID=82979 RepID=A0A484ZF19_9GAMM|nr:Uncharacterised protein [Budvicia aquatica]
MMSKCALTAGVIYPHHRDMALIVGQPNVTELSNVYRGHYPLNKESDDVHIPKTPTRLPVLR